MNMLPGRAHCMDIPEDQGTEVLVRARAHQLWLEAGKPAGFQAKGSIRRPNAPVLPGAA